MFFIWSNNEAKNSMKNQSWNYNKIFRRKSMFISYLPWIIGCIDDKKRCFDLLSYILWEETLQIVTEVLDNPKKAKNARRLFRPHSPIPVLDLKYRMLGDSLLIPASVLVEKIRTRSWHFSMKIIIKYGKRREQETEIREYVPTCVATTSL